MKPYYCKIETYQEKPAICVIDSEWDKELYRRQWAILDPEDVDSNICGVYVTDWTPENKDKPDGDWFIVGYLPGDGIRERYFKVRCKMIVEFYTIKSPKRIKTKYCKTCRNLCFDDVNNIFCCALTDENISPKNEACNLYFFNKYWKEKFA